MADKKFGVKQIDLIGASGTPTLTSPNNLSINAINVAISTDISVGGRIVGTSTSNVIPFLYNTYSDLPSASTYHGAFAHVHESGKALYAHSSSWFEIVNKESNGTVGTGTEVYSVGSLAIPGGTGTSNRIEIGDSREFTFQYNTSTTKGIISAVANPIDIQATTIKLLPNAGENGVIVNQNGSVELYHDNSKKFETTGVGVTITGSLYGDASRAVSGKWTLGANGSSNYTFDGVGVNAGNNYNTPMYLARGCVYEFVNNSGGSHPFQIRVSNGGAAYSTGVTNNGASSGTIRFEVPMDAPNSLYYQCTSHSGMGGTITVYPDAVV